MKVSPIRTLLHGVLLGALAVLAVGGWAYAALSPTDALAPSAIPFRGHLEQGGTAVHGTRDLTFRLYDVSSGGAHLWEQRQNGVVVSDGAFAVQLDAVPDSVLAEPALYVGIVVHDGVDVALVGRQRLSSVPYSRRAANGVPAGTIAPFAGRPSVVPAGWILGDGRALDADDPRYAELFQAIGTAWGSGGGGASDFNAPDLRGAFLRGLSDGSGPFTIDTARTPNALGEALGVGSRQGYATGNPAGGGYAVSGGSHTHRIQAAGSNPAAVGATITRYDPGNTPGGIVTSIGSTHTHVITSPDAETRPVNVYVTYIVKL